MAEVSVPSVASYFSGHKARVVIHGASLVSSFAVPTAMHDRNGGGYLQFAAGVRKGGTSAYRVWGARKRFRESGVPDLPAPDLLMLATGRHISGA